jgi:ATP-binding cassette subfamily E protein 1
VKSANPIDWQEILQYFRGSELQNYLTRILEDDIKAGLCSCPNPVDPQLEIASFQPLKHGISTLKTIKRSTGFKSLLTDFNLYRYVEALIKPQYVDHIPKAVKGEVGECLSKRDERDVTDFLIRELDLENVLDRSVKDLSGGELQRFAIAIVAVQDADVYMFDEPSSYLDVKQRLKASRVIRSLIAIEKYIIVVEHDLSVLDYLSDFICCLYGKPGAYGVVTMPFGVREGINIFLAGFVPTENLRFREEALTFKVAETADEREGAIDNKFLRYKYPAMTKTQGNFKLKVEPGEFTDSEIIVLLGENGTGKTTFIRLIAGLIKPDDEEMEDLPEFNVSYKPQKISPKFDSSVRNLLHKKIRDSVGLCRLNQVDP